MMNKESIANKARKTALIVPILFVAIIVLRVLKIISNQDFFTSMALSAFFWLALQVIYLRFSGKKKM